MGVQTIGLSVDLANATLPCEALEFLAVSMANSALDESGPRRRWGWIPGWLFAPDGRCGRADFFYALVIRMVVLGLLSSIPIGAIIAASMSGKEQAAIELTIGFNGGKSLFLLAFLLSLGGPAVRRLHDLDLSGLHAPWLALACVLGQALGNRLDYANDALMDGRLTVQYPATMEDAALWVASSVPPLLAFGLLFWPGTAGPNRYGRPRPLV